MIKSGSKESILIIVHQKHGAQSTVKYTYTATELRAIGTANHGKLNPPYHAIRKIKELRINQRRVRLQRHNIREIRKCNLANLKDLERDLTDSYMVSKI